MSEITIRELMERLPKAFQPEAAGDVDTNMQFRLTGAEASDWYVIIKDGKAEVYEGVIDDPRMTLTADSQDYKDMVTGRSNAMQAFMGGKLKLSGDLMLAMKMPNMFRMGSN